MKRPLPHQHNAHWQAQSYRWSSGHLVNRRARLRVLIYTMEHDMNVHPQPWQLLSLKKTLGELEHRLGQPGRRGGSDGIRSGDDEKSTLS